MNTLIKAPETDVQATRNRLRDHQEKFANLSTQIKVSQTCEIAGFVRKVSPAQCFRTIHDIDDGFGEKTGACKEYTQPRDHENSEPVGWIRGFAKIGSVIQVRATCYLDHCGIEIQVTSTLKNGSFSGIMKIRGPNHHVDKAYEELEEP